MEVCEQRKDVFWRLLEVRRSQTDLHVWRSSDSSVEELKKNIITIIFEIQNKPNVLLMSG